jgi:hypothetical protein
MDGTPWGYIHQKNRADAADGRSYSLEKENEQLKKIVQKLLGKKPLDKSDKSFLAEKGLTKSKDDIT